MTFTLLAKIVSFLHDTFIIGWAWGFRYAKWKQRPKLYIAHRGIVVVLSLGNLIAGRCPVTMLEEYLRQQDDPDFQIGSGHIGSYFEPLGIEWLPGAVDCCVGGIIHVTAVIVLIEVSWMLYRAWKKRKRRPAREP